MQCILASVVALGILVATCNAACFNQPPELKENLEGCLYKDELHELGSEFRTKDCYDCTCSMDGSMRCCQAYGTPVGYDKKKCKAIFNKKTCTYRVVEKKDRSKECEGHAMVG
ncbi:hypothetical protein XENTR_v10018270 [Xenopus tropicalis]|uniref:Beta-microseminoprotein n=1 Tax=Xenopus tropicalis TaxID=8364 RepID=A0A803JU25_XENTR|nr:beta-microseminoprotein isoform X1 [Xenopus tropicalis]XP_012822292.1 beta-microseminoprotein isoform X2 [Xenopus tropicalis]XP_031762214.1 beta-microseminoprotein isoform X2 [Xenopus tropicalis]KAE8590996.1 hypothetical protein XENTR_v10018270 [Xenopus tropicalis]|eukprot:XP_012822292.1 PREDICTED: beta-microseminoprotein-like isoform X1 [Xenopus tropicalis]